MILPALLAALLVPAAAAPFSESVDARRAQGEYLRGTLLERRGADAEALEAYEKALALDPTSAFIAGEAAELALETNDFDRAEKWSRRRLELAPKDPKSRLLMGRVLWARGDAVGAQAELVRALESDPSSREAVFSLVELIAVDEPKRARELLETFLKGHPEHAAGVLYELGRLDAQEERYDQAVEKLQRSIALDDAESGPARMALAQVYEILRDTSSAIAAYQRLLVDEPGDLELGVHLGELQGAAGDSEAARETFLALKRRQPDEPAVCAWLAADAERAGDFARAAAFLRDSAALKDDPTLNLRLGYYLLQARGVKEAMAVLRQARKRWPEDDRIAYYLALGHDDLGEGAQAVKLLREVLAAKPDDREARWRLAAVLERRGQIAEAELEFRRLLDDKPDDAPALNYLGYALADRGLKLDEAESFVRRALSLEPANAAYRDSLGWTLFKLGRSTEAARELALSAEALPEDGSVWDHLGSARLALGREEAAWRAWRLAQSFGSTRAAAKAEALQKGLSRSALDELWSRHLEAVHGGLRRFSALCDVSGSVAGRSLSQKAMLVFRAPKELSMEILGPLFMPLARARVDALGFSMDRFSVPGADDERVRAAAEGLLSSVASLWAGEPYAPGAARSGAWRMELSEAALLASVSAAGGPTVKLVDFQSARRRRVPRSFAAKGPFWEFSLDCGQPRVETLADEALPEAR